MRCAPPKQIRILRENLDDPDLFCDTLEDIDKYTTAEQVILQAITCEEHQARFLLSGGVVIWSESHGFLVNTDARFYHVIDRIRLNYPYPAEREGNYCLVAKF